MDSAPHRRRMATALVLWLAGAAIGWLRLGPTASNVVWAEDGTRFLTIAMSTDNPLAWFIPVQGYLHVLPRLAASLTVAVVPPGSYAVACAVISIALASALSMSVWFTAADLVPDDVLRALLALTPMIIPIASREVLGNLANVHWYCIWALFWLLFYRPITRLGAAAAIALALLAGLSEVQVIVLVPFALWACRDRSRRPLAIAMIVAAGVQAVANIVGPSRDSATGSVPSAPEIASSFSAIVLGGAVSGDLTPFAHPVVRIALLLVWGLLVVAVLVWGTRGEIYLARFLTSAALVFWTLAVVSNRPAVVSSPLTAIQWPSPLRYAVVPGMFALATLVVAVQVGRRRWPRPTDTLTLVAFVAIFVTGISQPTLRDHGPTWPTQTELGSRCINQTDIRVQIAPQPRWSMRFPCSQIDRSRPP